MGKMAKTDSIHNVIIVSDLHIGCRMGLCPPMPQPMDDGGTYTLHVLQRKMWEWWEYFWNKWVPKACRKEPFAVVINGDVIEGVHHGVTTQWTQNKKTQRTAAKEILKPIVKKCEGRFFMIRGTTSHTGQSGEDEEEIADDLGAIPDDRGKHARYELWLQVGGGLIHVLHHISTTGSQAYETTALSKEYTEACAEAGRWDIKAPNIVVRSHRHRLAETRVPAKGGYGTCVVTPGWQLKTPLVYRIPGGRQTTSQMGGILIRYGDEELYTRHWVRNIEREKTEIIKVGR